MFNIMKEATLRDELTFKPKTFKNNFEKGTIRD